MKASAIPTKPDGGPETEPATDFLILSDGTILAHNLTPVMAAILTRINSHDEVMQERAGTQPCERDET